MNTFNNNTNLSKKCSNFLLVSSFKNILTYIYHFSWKLLAFNFQPEQFFWSWKAPALNPKKVHGPPGVHRSTWNNHEMVVFCPPIWKMCSSNYGSFPWFLQGSGWKFQKKYLKPPPRSWVQRCRRPGQVGIILADGMQWDFIDDLYGVRPHEFTKLRTG